MGENDFRDKIVFHMGQQTQFQENITGWMQKIDRRLEKLPEECHTGRDHERRLSLVETENIKQSQSLSLIQGQPLAYDTPFKTKAQRAVVVGGVSIGTLSGVIALVFKLLELWWEA